MKALLLIGLLFEAVACGGGGHESSPTTRYENRAQGYSLAAPDGWSRSDERGAVRLVPAPESKHTIVVRSAPKPELVAGKPATDERLIAATRRVLAAMPGARLEDQGAATDTQLPGFRFALSFTPAGARQRYRREHYVLIGARHLFHVFCTVPAGEALDRDALAQVVRTLEEET